MKVVDYIAVKIERFPKGYVFTYADFITDVNNREAVIKALNRMAKSGKIGKLAKGRFYKPEITAFGNLMPYQKQIVKDLLEQDGKTIGYLTGYSIYNQLGITTQMSTVIQIGRNEVRPAFKRGMYRISFIRQKNTISKENIPLLQLLDTIRNIKKIPDTTVDSACKRLLTIFKKLGSKDKTTIVRLALKYPPATRALLGALLDEAVQGALTEPLLNSLNPITKYKLAGAAKVLSTTEKWSIV
ncbi:MAG: DUF6088 family protein [Bacteroidota bacterium]